MVDTQPEVWLRGPVDGVPALLQPVSHALLQAREEVRVLTGGFPAPLLWERPAGVASVGFHLQHISGAVDRPFTDARGDGLTTEQLEALATEGTPTDETGGVAKLVGRFNSQVDRALAQLRHTDEAALEEACAVGRRKLAVYGAGPDGSRCGTRCSAM